jgi:hypothetical protein
VEQIKERRENDNIKYKKQLTKRLRARIGGVKYSHNNLIVGGSKILSNVKPETIIPSSVVANLTTAILS